MRLERFLDGVAREALASALAVEAPALLKKAQDPKHGDYQVNGLLPLAKRQGKNPRELAEPVAVKLREHPAIASAEIAGPGFVNLALAPAFLASTLKEMLADPRLGVPLADRTYKTVVDYSSPNIAKQMHVGHLRSTILGHAIVGLLRFVGDEVIGDNHVGDWGTQYGMLIAGMRRLTAEGAEVSLDIAGLERIYKHASALAKTDEAFAAQARAELARLQVGDAENRALWERFVATTRAELDRMYARLGIRFESWHGESFYEPMLPGVVDRLVKEGLAREDAGALCVFFGDDVWAAADPKLRKQKEPFIVRKKDGAFLYSTTDIATALHRKDVVGASRSIYVVDRRQSQHFEQLFAVVRKLGVDVALEHVGFGTILGTDGTPLKTRDGDTIALGALLDEAKARTLAMFAAREAEGDAPLGASELDAIAEAVGVGAVKYADLRQNRLSDYQFDWAKMIDLKGNSGPYIQYAAARAGSLLRKGGIDDRALAPAAIELVDPSERELALTLARFPDAVHAAADELLPHLVSDHCFAVAQRLSTFYERCNVLKSEGVTRDSRLALVSLAGRQLRKGLELLGIQAIERM